MYKLMFSRYDFALRKSLKPLVDMSKVNDKPVINPRNFKGEPMVTNFIRSVGS